MNMQIWDKYNEHAINLKVKYFFDIWEDICISIENPSIDFDLSSPHYTLVELLDELQFNQLKNQDNKNYYIGLLNYFYNNDKAIVGTFQVSLRILRKEIQNQKYLIIRQIINNAIHEAEKGVYYFELNKLLKQVLLDETDLSSSHSIIRTYAKNMIIELLLRGYSIKTIKEIPSSVFDWYTMDHDMIFSNYPHFIKYKECKDKNDYIAKVKGVIDSLTIDMRIDKIKDYFSSDNNDYYYVFNIEGMSGDKEYKINNVVFYNPYKKQFIKESEFAHDSEKFGIEEKRIWNECNNKSLMC